jgi:uncharacterized protein
MDTARIIAEILKDYPLNPRGYHGVVHWARVMENGLRLAETTGANTAVVRLFALFHDSRRENDGWDPGHGARGAELARQLRGQFFDLPDGEFETLYRACEQHTGGRFDPDVTVLTCWDADRLDLGRVGTMPSPKLLCTPAARDPKTIDWAHTRSVNGHEPPVVVEAWGLPPREW